MYWDRDAEEHPGGCHAGVDARLSWAGGDKAEVVEIRMNGNVVLGGKRSCIVKEAFE